jgi:membrane protein
MSSKAILVSALCAMIVWSGVSYIVFLIDFDFREEQRLYGEVASLVVLLLWFFVTARALIFSLAFGVYLVDGKSK